MKTAAIRLMLRITLALLIFIPGAAFGAKPTHIMSDDDGNDIPITSYSREDSSKYFLKKTYTLDSSSALFPWALTISNHSVWVIGELAFRTLEGLVPDGSGNYPSSTTAYRIPLEIVGDTSKNAPFRGVKNGSPLQQVDYSTLGEEIIADELGRIWFAQPGNALTTQSLTNYSRVISYEPPSANNIDGKFCVYNIPDDNAEVLAVAWDADRDLLWFTQSSVHGGIGAIVSFSPSDMAACSNDYKWKLNAQGEPVTAFEYDYCDFPETEGCFTKYPLPADFPIDFSTIADKGLPDMNTTGFATFLTVLQAPHPDAGAVWFSLSAADAIGRLEPDTPGTPALKIFPIGNDAYSRHWLIPNNAGVWDIDVHPHTGDIVFTGYSGRLLGRFDISRYLASSYEGECEAALGGGQVNPCMQLMPIPRLSSVHYVHQLDFDKYGNAWFSVTTEGCLFKSNVFPHEPASIGFVNSDWTEVVYFDDLNFNSDEADEAIAARIDDAGRLVCNGDVDYFYTGIGTDFIGDRLNVWFTDSFSRKIRRLEVKPEYIGKNLFCEISGCT